MLSNSLILTTQSALVSHDNNHLEQMGIIPQMGRASVMTPPPPPVDTVPQKTSARVEDVRRTVISARTERSSNKVCPCCRFHVNVQVTDK